MDWQEFFEHEDAEGFEEFLENLVQRRVLEGGAEGITKQVLDRGMGSLSEKQRYVFETHVLNAHVHALKCKACGSPIPFNEQDRVAMDGAYCYGCAEQLFEGKE